MTVKEELINLTDYLFEHAYLTDYQRKLLIAHIREDIPIPVRFNINTMFTKPVSEPFSSVTNYLAYLVQLGFLTDEEAKTIQKQYLSGKLNPNYPPPSELAPPKPVYSKPTNPNLNETTLASSILADCGQDALSLLVMWAYNVTIPPNQLKKVLTSLKQNLDCLRNHGYINQDQYDDIQNYVESQMSSPQQPSQTKSNFESDVKELMHLLGLGGNG